MDNNLKNIRKKRNISAKKIAEFLHISEQYYYDLEKGAKRLNEDIILRLADFYNVTSDYLFGRTNIENYIVAEGENLPESLRGLIDAISSAKESGLSEEEIKYIIEFQTKLRKGQA